MYKHLTQPLRYYIYMQLSNGISVPDIAKAIKFDKSAIYRELKCNADEYGRYYEVPTA